MSDYKKIIKIQNYFERKTQRLDYQNNFFLIFTNTKLKILRIKGSVFDNDRERIMQIFHSLKKWLLGKYCIL